MAGNLNAISYFHRVKNGMRPVASMPRVMLMARGMRLAIGPTQRKLPIALEDLGALKGMLGLRQIAQSIVWASVLIGLFFMLRMIELLDTKNQGCRIRGSNVKTS